MSNSIIKFERQVLDHGYIRLIESWGSDERIVETARTSTSKGFLGWSKDLPMKCSKCTKLDQDVLSPIYTGTGNPPCVDGTQNHEFIYQPGDEKLLAFLLEMHHDTPFEFGGLQLEIQAPIFVFREWHRHRTQSFSEASSRYEPLPDKNYVPTEDRLMMQVRSGDKKNRQATAVDGAVELTLHNALAFRNELSLEYQSDENFYQKYLKLGVPKELARVALPVGRYSKMRAQAVLRNWLAFLTLRKDMSAQYEIRVYADVLGEILQEVFPRTWDLFSLNHVGTWGQESLAYYDHQIKRLEARLEKMKAGRAKQFSAQVQEKATEGWDKQ